MRSSAQRVDQSSRANHRIRPTIADLGREALVGTVAWIVRDDPQPRRFAHRHVLDPLGDEPEPVVEDEDAGRTRRLVAQIQEHGVAVLERRQHAVPLDLQKPQARRRRPERIPDPGSAEPVGADRRAVLVRRCAAAHRRPCRHIGDRDELRLNQVLGRWKPFDLADAMQQPVPIDLQDLGYPGRAAQGPAASSGRAGCRRRRSGSPRPGWRGRPGRSRAGGSENAAGHAASSTCRPPQIRRRVDRMGLFAACSGAITAENVQPKGE